MRFSSPIDFQIYHQSGYPPFTYTKFEHLVLLTSYARRRLTEERISKRSKLYMTFFHPMVTQKLQLAFAETYHSFTNHAHALAEALIFAIILNYKQIVDPFKYLPERRRIP